MSRATVIAVVLFLVPLFGCGGCKKGEGDNNGYQVPDGELGEVLGAMCGVLDRCPDAFGSPIAYRSRSECAAILNFVFTCRLTEQEVGDDRTVYSVEQRTPEVAGGDVDACKAWLADASCEDIQRGGDSPCATVLSLDFDDDFDDGPPPGTADVDEPCEREEDCLPELYCTGGGADPAMGVTYCSVCRPRAAEGDDCSETPCAPGFWCRGAQTGDPLRCSAPEVDGFRCYDNDQCASGFCNQSLDDGGGWGLCDPGGDLGDPCDDEYADDGSVQPTCREELHCEDGTCQAKRPNGGSCSDHYACELGNCHAETGICGAPDGAECSYDEQCAALACVDDTCGLTDGQCFLDADCGAGEVCAGACQPPNCDCSGCPVGECVASGGGGEGPCVDDFDCDFGDCVDGTCKVPEVGDVCSGPGDCYPLQCVNGACAAKAGPGQECGALDSCQEPFLCIEGTCQIMNLTCAPARAGQRCAWLRVCDDSSWCDLLDNVTCKPRAAVGQPCQTTPIRGVETCMPGSTCQYDEAAEEQRCVKLPSLGQSCTTACADSVCWGGTCRGAPVGTPCDYDTPCPAPLRCEQDREICVPLGAAGDDCDGVDHCATGFFCENYDTCQPRKAQNEDCRDSEECLEDFYCSRDTYTCVPRLGQGAECSSSEDVCAPGFFCPSGSSTCEPARPPGAECFDDYECLSGFCANRDFCAVSTECTLP